MFKKKEKFIVKMPKIIASIKRWLLIPSGIALILAALLSISFTPDSGGAYIAGLGSSFLIFPFFTLGIGSAFADIIFIVLYVIQGILLMYMGWKRKIPNKALLASGLFYTIWVVITVLSMLIIWFISLNNPTSDWGQAWFFFLPLIYLALAIGFISFVIGLILWVVKLRTK